MMNSIYAGYSGLMAYSDGLNTISDNIGNMNTPGYKGDDLIFGESLQRVNIIDAGGSGGVGVETRGLRTDSRQGDLQNTGNETDLAIDGRGFFVGRDDDALYYSRNGQFAYDEEGCLVLSGTDVRVCAYDENGQLVDISIDGMRVDPPKATETVTLSGNIRPTESHYELSDVQVYDTSGTAHAMTIVFDNPQTVGDETNWDIEVKDEDGTLVATGLSIRFDSVGLPADGGNTCVFTYAPDGATPQDVVISIGEPGSISGMRSRSSEATQIVSEQDGYALGSLMGTGFSRTGVFYATYSNDQTRESYQLALAEFQGEDSLKRMGAGLYAETGHGVRTLGRPGEAGLGQVVEKTIELSNVDLTAEFTDMIIIQRGYQASSQVLTAANEMIQQLLEGLKTR